MSRILTIHDLQTRTLSDLYVLRGATMRDVAQALPGSADHRDALASLHAVDTVLRQRLAPRPRP